MIPANLRPDLARHLHQRVHALTEGFRHNLALIGPPGSGKTFQLQRVLAEPSAQLTVVSCSLYRESPRSFLRRFLCAILQAGMVPPPATSPQAAPPVAGRGCTRLFC